MVQIGINLTGTRADVSLTRSTTRAKRKVLAAARGAAQDAASTILTEGRADIQAAGNFGSAWTEGLQAKVTEGGGHVKVTISHDNPLFNVFERGALIKGKPLLWIPLSFATEAQHVYARDYPGKLFSVNRKSGGAPLLFSAADRQPKYFGIAAVNIPKKFHILEIINRVATRLKEFYASRYREL